MCIHPCESVLAAITDRGQGNARGGGLETDVKAKKGTDSAADLLVTKMASEDPRTGIYSTAANYTYSLLRWKFAHNPTTCGLTLSLPHIPHLRLFDFSTLRSLAAYSST